MRLHHLRIRAFGPFADEVSIDFDEIGCDGLFLMHGQTGAGKTTILDAVAFALYGRVPGARDTHRRLHSDHADPQAVPEVTLEATIGGRRVRIRRSPEYVRPKKRGTGTTKTNASATLVWLDGSRPDLTRLPEIGEAVTGLLGMSADQFFQVVLLPQGDFARFLRAQNDEREQLLEKLFDTARFGDLENWLRDRARTGSALLAQHSDAVDRLAGQIAAVSGGELSAEPDMDWADSRLSAMEDQARDAAAELATARAAARQAQEALDTGRTHNDLRGRGEKAAARLVALREAEPMLAAVDQSLAAARRAAVLVPLADDVDAALTAREKAEAARVRAQAPLIELPEGDELCAGLVWSPEIDDAADGDGQPDTAGHADDDSAIDRAIAEWTAESGRWEPLARRVSMRPQMISDIENMVTEIDRLQRRITDDDTALTALPVRRDELVATLTEATRAGARVPVLAAERREVESVATALSSRESLTATISEKEREVQALKDSHLSAREALVRLRERRIAGMAAELARHLVDGQACAVCGSLVHPQPAMHPGDAERVGDAEESRAVEAERRAADRSAAADAELRVLLDRREGLDGIIGGAIATEVTARLTALDAQLSEAEAVAAQADVLEREITRLDEHAQALRARIGEAHAQLATLEERIAGARADLTELDDVVREATGGVMSVTERREHLALLCARASAVRDTRRAARQAIRTHHDLSIRLQTRCAEAGFGDVAALRDAAADDRQIAEWDRRLREAAQMRAAAQETLDDPQVARAREGEAADVAALEALAAAARTRADDAAARHGVAAQRLADTADFRSQFWAALDVLAPLQDKHAELAGLAELVAGRGANAKKMTLRSYVLAARLEEVLVAASARLLQMSAGRYEFAHSDAVGPRGRRGGLGIEVRDGYTGVVRAATTLSGGETFFASLALALGLADVVSAESGGRVLDTIFIDEGFGSLDPEALDLVMGVLDELRSGGRVVGVVSHVDELRARIPAQLQVLRGEDGSSVRVSGTLLATP